MDLSRRRFEHRLAAHRVPELTRQEAHREARQEAKTTRRSAVAAVLRFDRGAPDVLLMQRVVRAGDLWSGHISLPGGGESPADADLVATAMRETLEEVGVDLRSSAQLLGRLAPVPAVARGRTQPMVIAPYVFVQTGPAPIVLGPEAQHAFWLPLDRAAAGELSGEHAYELDGAVRRFPCWRYQGHVVWGLTYHMLADLLQVVAGPPAPEPRHP